MKKLLSFALSLFVASNVFAASEVEEKDTKQIKEEVAAYVMQQKAHYESLGFTQAQVLDAVTKDVAAVAEQGGLSMATQREKGAFAAGVAAGLAAVAAFFGLKWAYNKFFAKKGKGGKDDKKDDKDDKDDKGKKGGKKGGKKDEEKPEEDEVE